MAGGPKKHKADAAIIAILTSPSIQEATTEAGIAERTLSGETGGGTAGGGPSSKGM